MSDTFIVFASGEPHPGEMVQRVLSSAEGARVIAADGGALIAREFGLQPERIIGDFDSLTEAQQQEFQDAGVLLDRYSPEKDETDLELALTWAAEQSPARVIIVGAVGGRIDQTLANIYLLTIPELADVDISIVAGNQRIGLLEPGEHTLYGQDGDTLSLLPLIGDVEHITTTGLYYSLSDDRLVFGLARGVSNVFTGEKATLDFKIGLLLFVHTLGRA